jgi:hypothetical protein
MLSLGLTSYINRIKGDLLAKGASSTLIHFVGARVLHLFTGLFQAGKDLLPLLCKLVCPCADWCRVLLYMN